MAFYSKILFFFSICIYAWYGQAALDLAGEPIASQSKALGALKSVTVNMA